MIKRLHTKTKIFFPDPYVIRLSYHNVFATVPEREWRELTRKTYKIVTGTWGYTELTPEMIQIKNDFNHPVPPGQKGFFGGLSQNVLLGSLLNPDYVQELRGYLCFENELDALQFRLTVDTRAVKVDMWPSDRYFTIHEFVQDES